MKYVQGLTMFAGLLLVAQESGAQSFSGIANLNTETRLQNHLPLSLSQGGDFARGSGTKTSLGASTSLLAGNGEHTGSVTVTRTVDDFQVLGGDESEDVDTKFNLDLHGMLLSLFFSHGPIQVSSQSSAEVDLSVVDTKDGSLAYFGFLSFGLVADNVGLHYLIDQFGFDQFAGLIQSDQAEVLALASPGGIHFHTDPFTLTSYDTYSVSLSLSVGAVTDSNDDGLSTDPYAASLFDGTLSFGKKNILDLPTGMTVNSPQSGIQNNSLDDDLTPEPSTLIGLSFGGLALLRRRKARPNKNDHR
jgi:hypothetical protein